MNKLQKLFASKTSLQNAIQYAETHLERLQQSKRLIDKQIEVWEKKKENIQSQIKQLES
jgi:predicted  nucleic acid-binding Zn-ribbon protein